MRTLHKNIALLIFILLSSANLLFSQRGFGELYDFNLQGNGDTLRTTRTIGDWYVGLTLGGNINTYFGNLYLPRFPQNPVSDSLNPENTLTGGFGLGYALGIVAEYNPEDARYGFGFRALYYNRRFSSESAPFTFDDGTGASEERIKVNSSVNYFSISPFIRYNIINNFYLTAGADFELFNSITKQHIISFNNPDPIEDTRKLDTFLNNVNTRIGINFGLGYDLNVVDFNGGNRIFLNPYLLASYGSNMFSKDKSSIQEHSFSPLSIKLGIAIKYVRDAERFDTLRLDSNFFENPSVLVTAQVDQGVSYSGFQKQELLESTEIKASEINTTEQVKEEPVFAQEMAKDSLVQAIAKRKAEERIKKQDVSFAKVKKLSYPSSSTEELTREMKDYLDAIAQFLKENPKAKVTIEGHTDNKGTPEALRTLSNNRAQKALRYLLGKQISKGRILATGRGTSRPEATNETEAGRKVNRRLVIEVKQ